MHDKLLIVDGERMVVGDRNNTEQYYGTSTETFVSKDVYVNGPAARDAKAYFEAMIAPEMVSRGEVQLLREKTGKKNRVAAMAELERLQSVFRRMPKRLLGNGNWRDGQSQIPSEGITFFHDTPGIKNPSEGSAAAVAQVLLEAKKSIVIENPYIVLTPRFQEILKEKAAEGIEIQVITNSAASQDVPTVAAAWEESRAFLAHIKASIWEHPGKPADDGTAKTGLVKWPFKRRLDRSYSLHAKTMVVDGKISLIGSFNLDPRSEGLNSELGVVIRNEAFASSLLNQYHLDQLQYGYQEVFKNGIPGETPNACPTLYKFILPLIRSQL